MVNAEEEGKISHGAVEREGGGNVLCISGADRCRNLVIAVLWGDQIKLIWKPQVRPSQADLQILVK